MKKALFALLLVTAAPAAHAAFYEEEPRISTEPVGSPFYRHLAFERKVDLLELEKFEKHGFTRTEVCTIVLLSSATHVPMKTYGKRRLKEKISYEKLATEAHIDYSKLREDAHALKLKIEAMGSDNLPPPVYEPTPAPTPSPTPEPPSSKKEKKNQKKEKPRQEEKSSSDAEPVPSEFQ